MRITIIRLKNPQNKQINIHIIIFLFSKVYQIKEVICSHIYEPIEHTSGSTSYMARLGKLNEGAEKSTFMV